MLQATAAAGSHALLIPASRAAGTSLEGYASATSVAAGGTLDFFLRDPQAVGTGTTPYPVTVTRIGFPDSAVLTTTVNIGNQVVPADATSNGCRWARSWQLVVPASWKSGLYFAYVGSGANACTVPFVVRAASATAGVKVLVQIQASTAQAYNTYGGKSLYDYNSSGGVRAPKVSFDRPFTEAFNSFFDVYAQYLVRWLAKNNIAADFCTDIDIVANPAILNPYQLFVDVGHDEYWTLGRRNTMDAFVARGGNAAYFGANTSWFQSRLESGNGVANRTLVCYKDAAADPIADPAQKTTNFVSLVPPNPENKTTGLGYLTGCSWTGALPRPLTNAVVMREEHWAFAGTGLARGAGFGGAYIGYECDSASFSLGAADQRAYPTGADGAPATMRILSLADGSDWNALSLAAGGAGEQSGYSMIAVFSRGGTAGTVFNVGTVEWAFGLMPELDGQAATPLSRITLNVINKLSAPWTETADVRQFKSTVGNLPNFYYDTGTTAPAGSGMVLDGWVFRGFAAAAAGSVPVYRHRSTGTNLAQRFYMLSLSGTAPAGLVADGVAFHAFASPRSDATAIYQHTAFNTTLQANVAFYSPLATPPAGWSAGPAVFYVPLDGTAGTGTGPTPSFALVPGVSSLSVVRTQTGSVAVDINKLNGFNAAVTFTVAGVPAGVTVTPTPATSTNGTSLVIAVSAGAALGNYPLTITGTSPATATTPATTATTTVLLSVTLATVQGSFALVPAVSSLSVARGQSASVAVAINKVNGFSAAVNFTVTGMPAGVTATPTPASSTTGTSLVIATSNTAAAGSYQLTVTGSSPATPTNAATSATTTVTVTITAPVVQGSFTLSANPGSLLMLLGGVFGANVAVNIGKLNGFNGAVTFSVTGLPNNMKATFTPASATSSTVLALSPTSILGAQRGFFTLRIKGSSGDLSASTTVRLTVL